MKLSLYGEVDINEWIKYRFQLGIELQRRACSVRAANRRLDFIANLRKEMIVGFSVIPDCI